MKFEKLRYEPYPLADFFTDSLHHLGAVCERSWHDRIEVLAEGPSARVWSDQEALIEASVRFTEPGDTSPKNAANEVFPGCPLTFRLSELVLGNELVVDRCAIEFTSDRKPPTTDAAARAWHAQFPGASRWEQLAPFRPDWSFSLVAVVRCEVQAIDQHWFLHRLAISLPDGAADEHLAANLEFAAAVPTQVSWPSPDLAEWGGRVSAALQAEMDAGLSAIKVRQQAYLARELDRIDNYFTTYKAELRSRSSGKQAALKLEERLNATAAEHHRRREDQLRRHQIRVIPHVDALLLLAEPCWAARFRTVLNRAEETHEALYIPRNRKWKLLANQVPVLDQ